MIEVQGLTKQYEQLTAVMNVSFSVRPGEIMGLVSPNGAGKTTNLCCATGILPATHGTVRLYGFDLASDPVGTKRHIAFIADEPRLFDYLTVRQHLNVVGRLYGVADYLQRAEPLLAELEMIDKQDLLPSELPRGMKQKLATASGCSTGGRS
jgi:ABC-2 type transport system ATP-binding protein